MRMRFLRLNKKRGGLRSPTLLITIAILVLALLAIYFFLVPRQPTERGESIPSTSPDISSSNPDSGSNGQTNDALNSNPSQDTKGSSNGTTASGQAPITPYGDFVSNHHPGGDSPTSEASTCNTTPGAVCYIQFSQGSTVKKLNSQTVNNQGGTIWYWDVRQAGLTPGAWTITAVVTLNGQTKTANDAQPLTVQ